MPTPNFKFKLSALAMITGLGLLSKPALANNDHRIDNGVNKSGQVLLVIEDMVCEGNQFTACDFITKKFYQNLGDILDPQQVSDAHWRLNRLLQFVHVDVRLEKGQSKEHVVVVFDVKEADENQMDYTTSINASKQQYNYCDSRWRGQDDLVQVCQDGDVKRNRGSLGVGMIDYDFFDTGAQLYFGVSGGVDNNSQNVNYQTSPEPEFLSATSINMDADHRQLGFHLGYYEPHLFGSRDYFLQANYSQNYYYGDSTREINFAEEPQVIYRSDDDSQSSPFSIEFGRRFGRESFVSMQVDRVRYKHFSMEDSYTGYSIKYGWDSRDDTIFATEGSTFNSQYSYARGDRVNTLDVEYGRYHSLAENKVFSWQLNGGFRRNGADANLIRVSGSGNVFNYGLGLKYTAINDLPGASNTRSGWFTELNFNKSNGRQNGLPNTSIAANAGYTYQTPSMVYRFTLGISTSKDL